MKKLQKTRKLACWGFTLIELLATLTIMAVIAAILFPFVTNYTKKANHDTALRSLRILQDAMDRYRAVNTDFAGWPMGGTPAGATFTTYATLSAANTATVLTNVASAGTNQTIRMPTDGLTATNVYIVSTGADQASSGWEVVWFRRNTNVSGVNRKGTDITNWGSYAAASIDAAFQ